MTTTTRPTEHLFTSQWPDVAVPDVSLPEFLLAHTAERADHPALVDGPSGRRYSYGELAAGVGRVAAGLAARGLRKGDAFAILAPNMPEWLVGCYGAMAAGGVVSGINPLYTPAEVAGHLTGARARFLLTVPPFLATALAAVELAGRRVEIVLVGPPTAGCISFAELLACADRPPVVEIDPAVDLALLPHSSGTSGLPKGVMLTHRACVTNVVQQQVVLPTEADDRALALAPFFHAVGFNVIANATLHAGATVVTMPGFDVARFLEMLQAHRITNLVVVPPIVLALAKHPAVEDHDLSALKWVGCGAAPLGAGLQQGCARRLGRPVLQGYGMTELTAAATLWPLDTPVTPGSAGKLLPGVQARVVDLATGVDLGTDEAGELWLRSPATMAGYLHNPDATAATVDADGWVHTGDVARFDADGALFVVDRAKELIKVKGFQVARPNWRPCCVPTRPSRRPP